MDKIKKVSRLFRFLFQFIFIVIPFVVLWFWASFVGPLNLFSKLGINSALFSQPVTINLLTRILGIVVTMIPAGILMYALFQLIKLFKNYERGEIFILDNVNRYRRLGYSLFGWVIGGIIYDALVSYVLTFQNVGMAKKVIAVNFNGVDLLAIITGGLILLIAWVMKEAQQISEEQSLTI